MHFGFALEMSDIDLRNIDSLDTNLDLLDTDIPSKNFVFLHSVFKTSSRHVFKTSSRHVFKTSSRHVLKTSSRRLQRKSFSFSKTSWKPLQDVFKTSCKMSSTRLFKTTLRRLGRRKIVTLKTCWRHLQDVFKTNKRLLGNNLRKSFNQLRFRLLQFSWIPAIRNNSEIISGAKSHSYYWNCW